jgi:tetratricopeptide (TPR) repeat protein
VINIHMAWHHHFARQYEEALDHCRRTNELHPNSFWPPYFFALAYQQQGKIAEAAAEFDKAIQMSGSVTFATAGLGHLYASAGKSAEARAILDELRSRAQKTYVPAYDLALVSAGLGWTDDAFEWLNKALEERSGWLTYLKAEPRLDSLRGDSRFNDLLRRVRLI